MKKCNCVLCRYNRGEVSLYYALGYYKGNLEIKNNFLKFFKDNGIKQDIEGNRKEREQCDVGEIKDIIISLKKELDKK